MQVLKHLWNNFKDEDSYCYLLKSLLQAEQIIIENNQLPELDVETAQNIVINLLSARNGTFALFSRLTGTYSLNSSNQTFLKVIMAITIVQQGFQAYFLINLAR